MKVQNKNKSSRKTRELIKQTFSDLIKQKSNIKDITVTELVNKADITRSSFYTHYDNIYEVAKEIQNEALELFVNKHKNINSIDELYNYFDEIFELFKKENENYKNLLKGDFASLLLEKLRKQTEINLYDYFKDKNIDQLSLKISLFTDGCILLIIKYFNNELDSNLDEINIFLKKTFKLFFLN